MQQFTQRITQQNMSLLIKSAGNQEGIKENILNCRHCDNFAQYNYPKTSPISPIWMYWGSFWAKNFRYKQVNSKAITKNIQLWKK